MVEASKKFEAVISNENAELEQKFAIAEYPTLLFVNAETEEVLGELGARSSEEVVKQMKAILEKVGQQGGKTEKKNEKKKKK